MDFLQSTGKNSQVEAAIRNHEVAYKMQAAVPELCDLKGKRRPLKSYMD